MKLDELRDSITKLNDERVRIVQEEGQKALSGAFEELFQAHPGLESVAWTQYTPYFNDGDECVFRVNEMDRATYLGIEHECPASTYGSDELPKEVATALREIEKCLAALGDTLKLVFGDHVEVTAHRHAGFVVEEYEHD